MGQRQHNRKAPREKLFIFIYAVMSCMWTQTPTLVLAFSSSPRHKSQSISNPYQSRILFRIIQRRRLIKTFIDATPSTSSSSSSSHSSSSFKPKKSWSLSEYGPVIDAKTVERDIARLSRSGRVQDALSLYWSVWEMDDNNSLTKSSHPIKPATKLMNHAIDACARNRPSPLKSEAFHIFEHGITGGKSGHRRLSPNVYTFGALMSVCARVGDVHKCSDLLKSMKEQYGIKPNAVIYSTAISACERSSPPQPKKALEFLKQSTQQQGNNDLMDGMMSVVGYNAALSVLARVGDWKSALQLLDEMEAQSPSLSRKELIKLWHNQTDSSFRGKSDASSVPKSILDPKIITPVPDRVTYGTVMAACERAGKWHQVLRLAAFQEHLSHFLKDEANMPMDGMALTSALHACQQLGLADDAIRYLNSMKALGGTVTELPENHLSDEIITDQRRTNGRRSPLKGPDNVAYHLAISACARAGLANVTTSLSDGIINSYARWEDGIKLLREMERVTGCPPDVIAFTAAIGGCAEAGQWQRAFSLLNEMQTTYRIQPNVVTYSAAISSCANALARFVKDSNQRGSDEPLRAALQLLETMKKSSNSDIHPNIVTYNAAIRTCAEAHDLEGAFRLMDEVVSTGLTPTIVTFGSLMTACERVGSVDDMNLVFQLLNQYNTGRPENEILKANEIVYGAAISCCRKAGQADRAILLLKKMIKTGLSPNTATFNTVIMALLEGKNPDIDKALSVFKVMGSQLCDSLPNRQSFTIIIRALATGKRPSEAETYLSRMTTSGFIPDVDLFTLTVTSYERNREPIKALQLMESMREYGYDFYDIKVVNEAFKKAIKIVNVVGRGFKNSRSTCSENQRDISTSFITEEDDSIMP